MSERANDARECMVCHGSGCGPGDDTVRCWACEGRGYLRPGVPSGHGKFIDWLFRREAERDSLAAALTEAPRLHEDINGVGVWVCDKCGQYLGAADETCNSGFHVGPDGKNQGKAILSTAAVAALTETQQALARIAEQQPRTLATLQSHGIVFERGDIGNDPTNWAHVAFSVYTDLCEVDTIARAALADVSGTDTPQGETPEGV